MMAQYPGRESVEGRVTGAVFYLRGKADGIHGSVVKGGEEETRESERESGGGGTGQFV